MSTEHRDDTFTGLVMAVAEQIRNGWLGQALLEQSEATLDNIDSAITKAGHDPLTVIEAAYEWATQTYSPPPAAPAPA